MRALARDGEYESKAGESRAYLRDIDGYVAFTWPLAHNMTPGYSRQRRAIVSHDLPAPRASSRGIIRGVQAPFPRSGHD